MNKNFSLKLAMTNIRNHRKFYLPYFLASVGIIGMFYIITFLASSREVTELSDSLSVIMGMGVGVMAIFSFIFLFYTNSFLMKRRKKEIGLYNILGMEKRHIGKILLIENFFVSLSSMLLGLFYGILFSKLIVLILTWIFDAAPPFGITVSGTAVMNFFVSLSSMLLGLFYGILFSKLIVLILTWIFDAAPPFGITVSGTAVIWTFVLFGILFVLTTASNLMSIHLAKPVELLSGGNVGEKEPKARGLIALIGFACLGAGYYIAITTENPLDALLLFFVAVVLVIVGTYCIFMSGSIAVLKALRKNRKFYYRPGNFTAVSGMIYRMKQNAVGLANICILSTMVLVMVSGTVSLFFGMQDTINTMAPGDVNVVMFTDHAEEISDKIRRTAESDAEQSGLKVKQFSDSISLSCFAVEEDGNYVFKKHEDAEFADARGFCIVSEEDYTEMTGKKLNLSDGEVAVDCRGTGISDHFRLGSLEFTVKDDPGKFMESAQLGNGMIDAYYMVVPDEEIIEALYRQQKEVYGDNASFITHQSAIYLSGSDREKETCIVKMTDDICGIEGLTYEMLTVQDRKSLEDSYGGMVGGFLFLGVFLGIVFTFAAALIIYYKQISEGYYDKDKFEIMQKVGMSRTEVKKTIRRQVLLVFFIPLIMAGIHVAAAFKMITKLLLVFSMTNVHLFALCTVCTFLVFAAIYAAVYAVTAREYYKIVG